MAGGGGGNSGQSMLGGLMANSSGKGGWQGVVDPMGILLKAPPEQPPDPLDPPEPLPTMATPQSTDRLAFLKSFGITPDQLGLQGLQG